MAGRIFTGPVAISFEFGPDNKSLKPGIHLLGIRHHGPGSARSVVRALESIEPDVILLEGPPDGQEILTLAADEGMKPPVALLVYRPDQVRQAVYYPFAEFSPEWQTIQYGAGHKIPVRFMDLPQSRRLAMSAEPSPPEEVSENDPKPLSLRRDPMRFIAHAAGFEDSERWWEQQFETRQSDADVFKAVLELMTELRLEAEKEEPLEAVEAAREAHMRQTLREVQKEGFQRIAAVMGAWHVPALADMPPAARDKELLQSLPKCKTTATWVPWTYGRLLFSSGYGAGIESPGYYRHLWECRQPRDFTARWMTQVAQLLRGQDLEGSTASIIESTRLAETLSALRGRGVPGLDEFNEAARAVFCFGDAAPLRLIHRTLIVGERLGSTPESVPEVPIQTDLRQIQKRLRFLPEADEKTSELDLRKETDLEKSQLLHRLRLLNIPWGKTERSRGKGTFRETWRLRWEPDFEIRLIEASIWGNSVRSAVAGNLHDLAQRTTSLPELAALMQDVFLADLPETVPDLVGHLQNLAAQSTDVGQLMDALPPLAEVFRYGSVRQTETAALGLFVRGLVVRICIGLPAASASLGDEAAEELRVRLDATHAALANLQEKQLTAEWHQTLGRMVDITGLHGLVAGRCGRLLFDAGIWSPGETGRRLGLAISPAHPPAQTAAWIEGFLKGSGLMLLHNPALWELIDAWVRGLSPEFFMESLPLMRRTFSTFPHGERRQLLELAGKSGEGNGIPQAVLPMDDVDPQRASRTLPLLRQLLGCPETSRVESKP
jgi:hypothetical protein